MESVNRSKKTILCFLWPNENSFIAMHDTNDIKLLARFR